MYSTIRSKVCAYYGLSLGPKTPKSASGILEEPHEMIARNRCE